MWGRFARSVPAIAACALVSCGERAADAPQGAAHSVLVVTIDTTRPDHLSCYGYARPTTPEIDRLAARGALAENAWAQAPITGPSLASVLTSRRAPVTGVRDNAEKLRADLPTLATVASDAGHRTAAFVSTALLRDDVCAFGRGFDVYDDEMTDPCFGHDNAQRIAAKTIDRAVAWLAAADEPFVLWVHLYDPHGPYEPPAHNPRLDATTAALPSARIDGKKIPRYQRVGEGPHELRDYVDRYDHELAYADRELSRLFAAVELDTTVVAVHSDHGEALGEDDYWFRHGALLHDAALRIPWIVAGPGVPARTRLDRPVRNLDLVPTILSLAGLPPIPDAEGHDLSALVRGGASRPSPFEAVAEARFREDIFDSGGIDTRWKLRYVADGVDVTWWPADDRITGTDDLTLRARAQSATRAWLEAPATQEPPSRRPPTTTPEQMDALRSLGYR